MIGYKNQNGIIIGVGYIPKTKRPRLLIESGNCITPIATFQNEDRARMFINIFSDFIGRPKIDWTNSDEIPLGLMDWSEEDDN